MPPVSKIAQLPPEIRTWLHATFVKRSFGDIVGVTEDLNQLMKEAGVAITIGKSAVGEESKRVRRAQESIAAATRSMQLIADTARDDSDKRGEALMAMVSEGLFEALLMAREAEATDDPADRVALMNKAALASARLTTSSVRQRQWRHEVEERLKAATSAVEKIAKAGGLDATTVAQIREQILGVVATRPAAASSPAA